MLKGCQKRVVVLNDTKSRYFDSAYFILKSDIPQNKCSRDILREAEALINSVDTKFIEKKEHSDGILAYFSGAATVCAAAGAIALAGHFIL